MIKVRLVISEPWDFSFPDCGNSGIFILHDKSLFLASSVPYYKLEAVSPSILNGQEFPFLVVAQRHEGPDMIGRLNLSTNELSVGISITKALNVSGIEDLDYRYIGELKREP